MSEIRRKKLAKTLVNYSIEVKPEEWIVIRGDSISAPLLNDIAEAVLLAGGLPAVAGSTEAPF